MKMSQHIYENVPTILSKIVGSLGASPPKKQETIDTTPTL